MITKILSGLMLDDLDGKETLLSASEVFIGGIDEYFKKWHLDIPSIPTSTTIVNIHKLVDNATFPKMFGSIDTNLDKLCLTQAQIKNFCKKHPNWLCQDGFATFFLFKVRKKFFVASVDFNDNGLNLCVYYFNNSIYFWSSTCFHHLVVPQLTA